MRECEREGDREGGERGGEGEGEGEKTRTGAGGNVKLFLLSEIGFQGIFKFDANILFSTDLLKTAIIIGIIPTCFVCTPLSTLTKRCRNLALFSGSTWFQL